MMFATIQIWYTFSKQKKKPLRTNHLYIFTRIHKTFNILFGNGRLHTFGNGRLLVCCVCTAFSKQNIKWL